MTTAKSLLGGAMCLLATTLAAQQPASTPLPQAPAPGGATSAPLTATIPIDPQITTGQFANGLRYYIRANKKPEKRAELRLVVNAGSILEERDQSGLAHFVEHMAFNGTKHFPKQETVKFLESIGMRFGPSVNAFTSFDETVYMLEVPTDKPDVLDKAFLILEDWAHNVSFDDAEIDKERGVIMEEWRLRRGAGARMQDKQFPILFKGSRYAERLPIGDMEVIQSFKHERLKKFYEDWYRPELMAVVAVGDFDKAAIEALVKNHFETIPKSPRHEAAADLRRARTARHALRDRHRQGSVRHERRGLHEDAGARSDDGRRVPAADRRAAVRGHALGAILGDGAEARRAVPRRRRRPRPVRARRSKCRRSALVSRKTASSAGSTRCSPRRCASRSSGSPRPSWIGRSATSCAASSAPSPRRTTRRRPRCADEYVRNFTDKEPMPRHRVRDGRCTRGSCRRSRSTEVNALAQAVGARQEPRRDRERAGQARAGACPDETKLAAVIASAAAEGADGLRRHGRARSRCSIRAPHARRRSRRRRRRTRSASPSGN